MRSSCAWSLDGEDGVARALNHFNKKGKGALRA